MRLDVALAHGKTRADVCLSYGHYRMRLQLYVINLGGAEPSKPNKSDPCDQLNSWACAERESLRRWRQAKTEVSLQP